MHDKNNKNESPVFGEGAPHNGFVSILPANNELTCVIRVAMHEPICSLLTFFEC